MGEQRLCRFQRNLSLPLPTAGRTNSCDESAGFPFCWSQLHFHLGGHCEDLTVGSEEEAVEDLSALVDAKDTAGAPTGNSRTRNNRAKVY
jgi:hypothetical protein